MTKKTYDASSIEVVENLEAVRKRPGMYIGDTNSRGLHHLVKEIVDNSIDEHLAGFADKIIVTLDSNNSISIEDNGRGIPIDIHPKTKKTAVETVFTVLHAGGKFGGENSGYKVSGGLHGVGSSVVNALSEFLEVWIWKDKKEYFLKFSNGGSNVTKLKELGKTSKKGTKVKFKPDNKIFSTINLKGKIIAERLKELAYLNPGLKIKFIDNKNEINETFHYPEGIKAYVDLISKNQKSITKVTGFESANSKIKIKVAFKYTTSSQENIHSFVNNIITIDGGSHETAFKTSLTKSINEYASINKLQQGGKPLEGTDIREGLYAVISIYVVEELLQFEGQTKSKLSSNKVRSYAEQVIYENIKHYLNSNKNDATEIIKRAYSAKRAREAAKRAREVTKQLKNNNTRSFAGKLVIAQSKKASERELFIVEGDSAGGSAKLGRNRKIQAILPLKGKIVNTEKANLKSILSNDELSTMIYAIGGGLGDEFERKKVNYGKIIIMTDADTDGAHIQTLLLTFFYRFMKELIDERMIYIAMPPLFKITSISNKKEIIYAWSNEEMNKIRAKKEKIEIQRYKGLGEMNYEQLWETTMNPNTRTLIQVTAEEAEAANRIIETLMGQDPTIRREWIEKHVEFSLEDDYAKDENTINNKELIDER
ncbi:MAG: DNA topoisomerase 4 subunit B [Candidatus Tyloplasma litorale]|nr:MAG: DNA topoisomerase 4 subunit B [Mycoplasmatales bacterium]